MSQSDKTTAKKVKDALLGILILVAFGAVILLISFALSYLGGHWPDY